MAATIKFHDWCAEVDGKRLTKYYVCPDSALGQPVRKLAPISMQRTRMDLQLVMQDAVAWVRNNYTDLPSSKKAILDAAYGTYESLKQKLIAVSCHIRLQQSKLQSTGNSQIRPQSDPYARCKQLRESVVEAWLACQYFDFMLKDIWSGAKTADMVILEVPESAAKMDAEVHNEPYLRTYLSRAYSSYPPPSESL